MPEYDVSWTIANYIRVDKIHAQTGRPKMKVAIHFHDEVYNMTRLEKLELLKDMLECALNNPDMTEEPK